MLAQVDTAVPYLEIIYRDDELIAINKPANLLVHKSMIDRHEKLYAMKILRNQIEQWVYPIHRLDKPTSGVLLFALSASMAKHMSEVFKARESSKEYIAIVRGFTKEHERIEYPLKEVLDKIADRDATKAVKLQDAITSYTTLNHIELPYSVGRYATSRYSLLHVEPQTGRKHQIRRHLKHIFHPIVGDTTHGDLRHNRSFKEHLNSHRLLLHAYRLHFIHPLTHKRVTIEAKVDETFETLFERFGWNLKEAML